MAEAIAFEEALTELQQLVSCLESGAEYFTVAKLRRGVQLIALSVATGPISGSRLWCSGPRRERSRPPRLIFQPLLKTVTRHGRLKKPRVPKESPPRRGLFEAPPGTSPGYRDRQPS